MNTPEMTQMFDSILDSKFIEIEIGSLSDLEMANEFFSKDKWIFRGHENAAWRLQTSLERELKAEEVCRSRAGVPFPACMGEKEAVEGFRDKLFSIGKKSSGTYVGDLALMQHFGATTRLMDFTWSFWVALCFAYARPFRNFKRAVWAFRWRNIFVDDRLWRPERFSLSPDESFRTMHLLPSANTELPSVNDIMGLNKYAEQQIVQDISANANHRGVLPVFLPCNLCDRMDVQQGLFLMPVTFDPFVQNLAASFQVDESAINNPSRGLTFVNLIRLPSISPYVIKMVFPPCFEGKVRSVLSMKGLSMSYLYPDIAGAAISSLPSMNW